ncbi:hypothetical protein VXN63_02270 [Marinilactibacillus sp. XAAS-LB27]|uniref:hypothetical protein n=1 Tax=Marinilactibacillus sp. XAAS-LB27 TaxID=3114538 RepID=UPI002E1923F2|nr:hypothetical protein [Marinilactibacillus sp. XAAS-LB27]
MSDQTTEKPNDKLFIYAGEYGGRFLFDTKLNENEEQYNRFTYLGTFDEVISKFPSSLRSTAEKRAKGDF